MKTLLRLEEVTERQKPGIGGKAFALAVLARSGFQVPDALCVSTRAYELFVQENDLSRRIALEMGRKPFEAMRWEEIWDSALRIRNLFAKSRLPAGLESELAWGIAGQFGESRVSVRSSAPGEDSGSTSFAGLHESFVNVRGLQDILERIKLVWASLWSDRALMYRKEIGLDPLKSAMAVLIQEMAAGDCSGIVFGKNPNDGSQAVIESVHGLNQGLVDGTVEPDRWLLDRKTGWILKRQPASRRESIMLPFPEGVRLVDCPPEKQALSPLDDQMVRRVFDLALRAEEQFGQPQDMEWTFQADDLLLLQSRPITTLEETDGNDQRPWYRSLQRSFENLQRLQARIEADWLPDMDAAAADMARTDLDSLDDAALAAELEHRRKAYHDWEAVYWDEFIPMAHGMRLFAQVYNDALRPADPYEFMQLLGDSSLLSLRRNHRLEELADMIRRDAELARDLHNGRIGRQEAFRKKLQAYVAEFGDLTCGTGHCGQGEAAMTAFLLEMAAGEGRPTSVKTDHGFDLEARYLNSFSPERRDFARELLKLGRASYRLRDDDNVYLGRIRQQLQRAADEGEARLQGAGQDHSALTEVLARTRAVLSPAAAHRPEDQAQEGAAGRITARQLVGQPAGPGLARGKARVILSDADLMAFKAGEILVCDAVDPNMTFVAPLAAGIVERRGGMLIHGAIIAREYGLACVTGISGATQFIQTGTQLTVDGYLGLVILGH